MSGVPELYAGATSCRTRASRPGVRTMWRMHQNAMGALFIWNLWGQMEDCRQEVSPTKGREDRQPTLG